MKLLERARILLNLPGGPPDELAKNEIAKAARAIEKLHQGLVGDRALAKPQTYRGEMLGAYLLWWWPQTYVKVQAALRMAPMPEQPRILDVGSGPAPAAIAALDLLGGDATCFDVSEEALAEARALGITKTTRELPAGDFDLTLAANVLSELDDPLALVRKLSGTIVIVEPALKETSRALLELRDRVVAERSVLAPCLTQKPCPALASPKDWCTAAVRWTPPRFFRQLAQATGIHAEEMISFSPLILSREKPGISASDLWRVVGVPPPERGKRRVWLCNDEGRVPAVRLDKQATAENAMFEELDRGDLVQLRGLERRGDGLRVGPQSRVDRR
ncbi:MAG: small ribosomal subunit Rsm22 family protein [Myxococcales bacterium]|nr:small ribosomal subunit Rsm22 family protein [Myxococcales bacterium]